MARKEIAAWRSWAAKCTHAAHAKRCHKLSSWFSGCWHLYLCPQLMRRPDKCFCSTWKHKHSLNILCRPWRVNLLFQHFQLVVPCGCWVLVICDGTKQSAVVMELVIVYGGTDSEACNSFSVFCPLTVMLSSVRKRDIFKNKYFAIHLNALYCLW